MKKLLSITVAIFSLLFTKAQNCPGVSVTPYSFEIAAGDTLVFIAGTTGVEINVSYNWTISAGTIISGQGTAKIMVNTDGLGGQYVTATVELKGLPAKCTNTASSSVEVIPSAQLVASGTFNNGLELKKAVQKFIAATSFKDSATVGTCFIYLYKKSSTAESAYKIFKEAVVSAFEFNNIRPDQYKIADGGTKKMETYEMFLLLPAGKDPKPSN
jgi:hypothetical protein